MNFKITEIKIFCGEAGKSTLGYANITIDESFCVRNIRIVKGKKGVFIGMPSFKNKRGDYNDIFFPINQETRDFLTDEVIKSFKEQHPQLMEGLHIYQKEKQETNYVRFSM